MAAALLGILLAAACSDRGDGAHLQRAAREILGVTGDDALGNLPVDPVAGTLDVAENAWICTDPVNLRVQAVERTIRVLSCGPERGGAGVVVRSGGGAMRVRARVRVDHITMASSVNFGLCALGGATGFTTSVLDDAGIHVQFACGGGGGDVRLRIAPTLSGCTSGESSEPGPFDLCQDFEVTITCTEGEIVTSCRPYGRSELAQQTRLAGALPPGLYLLGCTPRVENGWGVDATVELREIDGDLAVVPLDELPLPAWVRYSCTDPQSGPLREIVGPLAGDVAWLPIAAEVRSRIERVRSVLDPRLDDERGPWLLQAWFETAAMRRAPPEARAGHLLAPLFGEVDRALTQRASSPQARTEILAWLDPGTDVAPNSARSAALLLWLAALNPEEAVARRAEALSAFPTDAVASHLWHAMEKGEQPCEALVQYLLRPTSDPQLQARCSERLLDTKQLDRARTLAMHALAGGVCDERLGQVIEQLKDSDELRHAWREARRDGHRLLRELVQRVRWMGLTDVAAQAAHVLLRDARSPEVVREVIPSLLLAREQATLALLLQDPDPQIRAAARTGLDDDVLVGALRAELIAALRK